MLADPIERRKQEIDVLVFDESPAKSTSYPSSGRGAVRICSVSIPFGTTAMSSRSGPISASLSAVMPEIAIGCCGVRAVMCSLTFPKMASEPRYFSQYSPHTSCQVVTSGVSVPRAASFVERTGKYGRRWRQRHRVRRSGADAEAAAAHARGEVNRFRDRPPIVVVQVGSRCDRLQCHPAMGYFVGTVPEMSTVDCHVVSPVRESRPDLVDPFLGTAGHERIHDVRHEGDTHWVPDSNSATMSFRLSDYASESIGTEYTGIVP